MLADEFMIRQEALFHKDKAAEFIRTKLQFEQRAALVFRTMDEAELKLAVNANTRNNVDSWLQAADDARRSYLKHLKLEDTLLRKAEKLRKKRARH